MSAMQTPTPSPLNVAYVKQVKAAQAASQRRRDARRHGYNGVLTRRDLAALALANASR